MQTDRTTKLLLLLIATGLWASVLKPAVIPPAVAAPLVTPSSVGIAEIGGVPVTIRYSGDRVYLAAQVEGRGSAWRPLTPPK
jgi:hypothetical protein